MNRPRTAWLAGAIATLAASQLLAQTPPLSSAAANAYQVTRSLGESSLPVAFVFGDPKLFCLPGDSACRPPAFPAGIAQPAPVVVATTTIGTCPIEIRTGNIALQTWLRATDRYMRGVNTTGFSFPALRPYNPDSAYFSAVIDLVAVPLDPVRCQAGQVASGARDLGYLSWGGSINMASYDGRIQAATPLNLTTPALRKLRIQWDSRAITVHIDDCREPLFETPVYQARATAPAALFPVVLPQVMLSPAAAAPPPMCKGTNMTIVGLDARSGRLA